MNLRQKTLNDAKANLELAKKVLCDVKASVVSSHDIISRIQMPFLIPHEFSSYKQRFGHSQFEKFMEHQKILESLRKLYQTEGAKWGVNPNSALQHMAIARFGVGECGEASYAAVERILMISPECPPVYLVVVFAADLEHAHSFVIIGDASQLKKGSLKNLEKLSDDCILLDPFLSRICQANSYHKDKVIQEYFNQIQFDRIQQIGEMPIKQGAEIIENTERVYQLAKKAYSQNKVQPFVEKHMAIREQKILADSFVIRHYQTPIALHYSPAMFKALSKKDVKKESTLNIKSGALTLKVNLNN